MNCDWVCLNMVILVLNKEMNSIAFSSEKISLYVLRLMFRKYKSYSIVFLMINRTTVTGLVWPWRCARPIACCSYACASSRLPDIGSAQTKVSHLILLQSLLCMPRQDSRVKCQKCHRSLRTHENHVRGFNQIRSRCSLAQTQQNDFHFWLAVFEFVQRFCLAIHVAIKKKH